MFESGQVLQERYQIQQQLGRTMAGRQTWLAADLASQSAELVIIKLLAFSLEMQWDDLKLFEREAKVLQNLNHSRIPQYRDYFLVDKQPGSGLSWWGLVQDYIPGFTLQELMEQSQRFTEQQLYTIAEQVLQILAYLHELNPPVLHRDLKPSNLIWGQDQQIYLVDFGAVQERASVTGMTFTVVGTSGYTPLEQFWGRAVPASDLYALGATLIHLLTGVAPAELPQSNLRIQFANRTNLSLNFVGWIEQLTAPALEQRFTTARQALEVLKHEMSSGAEIVHSSGSPQTVCVNSAKGIQGDRTCIVVEKSTAKMEIHKQQAATDFNSCLPPVLIFLLWLLSLGGGALAVLAGTLAVLSWISGLVLNLVNDVRRGELHGCFVSFDANNNYFEFSSHISAFNTSWGSGKVSDIQDISVFENIYTSGYVKSSTWNVTILADCNYSLSWGLTEEECIWLVNEIQSWLTSAKLKL